MNEVIPVDNHLAQMFTALYDALCIPFEIDGVIFTLYDVLLAGLVFSIISLALYEFVGKHLDL